MNRLYPHAAAAAAAIALALPAAGVAAAQPVSPWDDSTTARIVVPFTSAELRSPDGARAVAARIRVAADKACGGDSLVARTGFRFGPCKAAAIARALDDLNAPLVAQAMGRPPHAALAAR